VDSDPSVSDLAPEEGWTKLNLPIMPRFVSGEPNGDRFRVRYFRRQHDGALVGKAWFGPGVQGPPGHAHGGSMAALLDEVMGLSAWISGHTVVAARIRVNFSQMLPLGTIITFEGWVHKVEGKKVTARGRLVGPNNKIHAQGEGLFVILDAEQFGEFGKKADEARKRRKEKTS
jgi:acyl-coenzyme A thioesterase PaaI-like protein